MSAEKFVTFFEGAQARLAELGPEWLNTRREEAVHRFGELGLPTTKAELWKHTNLKPLGDFDFTPSFDGATHGLTRDGLKRETFGDEDHHLIVFVNGLFSPELSHVLELPAGVVVSNLVTAMNDRPDFVRDHLGAALDYYRDAPFARLNDAFFTDGAFVYLPKNARVEKPIQILFLTRPNGTAPLVSPRNLIVAENGAFARLVESYEGPDERAYLTNGVTEFFVAENANVDHYKLQREGHAAFHIATMGTRQEGSSRFKTNSLSFGGRLTRNDFNVDMTGEGGVSRLDGLFMTEGDQHVDHHTRIGHLAAHCESYEDYKGVLGDQSRGVFNGKIYVKKDAQKTDAKQSNKNLLLSRKALVNTKPELEIYADDVRCTHGATVGQLDDAAIFFTSAPAASASARR
ncbi:MAG: Fe-S cluster assembly protein SufD [Deltaproteobacteria bacterium]|nr:Fe-S cluster assembly protein SufD [Deltaproteobacteria bacterium]